MKLTLIWFLELAKFLRYFKKYTSRSEQCINELRGWGLSFANDVETVRGRMLDSEKIHMGFNRKVRHHVTENV